METGIAKGETGELPGVTVLVGTAVDGILNERVLDELVIKITIVSAQVTQQVTYFTTYDRLMVFEQLLYILVYIYSVDSLVIFLRDPRQMRKNVD